MLFRCALQGPATTDEAVLSWMESLREGHPSADDPRHGQWAGTPPPAGAEPGLPVSSVRAAAMRIEGQAAGGAPPIPDQDLLLRTRYGGHPRRSNFESAPTRSEASPAAQDPALLSTDDPVHDHGTVPPLDSEGETLVTASPFTGVSDPPDELRAPSEDDVVPELPDYGDEHTDEGDEEGRYEASEAMSEPLSEPITPSRPYASQSAPVTPARSAKKGWSFGRIFGSKKRKGGEGAMDDGTDALVAARSISAGDLGASLTSHKKKKGRFSRMFGRKRQV